MFSVEYQDKLNYKSQYRYSITSIRNLSRPSAIRLAAIVVLKHEKNSREDIKLIIQEITEQLKKLTFDFHWKKDNLDQEGGLMYERRPDVIWLYIKTTAEKYEKNDNFWLARTLWITKESEFQEREIVKPRPLNGNDSAGDIEIYWDWGTEAQNDLIRDIINTFKSKLKK